MVLLMILAALLGVAAGPASAIAVIPRLDWWDYRYLFSLYETLPDIAKKVNRPWNSGFPSILLELESFSMIYLFDPPSLGLEPLDFKSSC